MRRTPQRAQSGDHRVVHPSIGMRRIDWVGVRVTDGAIRCEAHGVGHRLPTARPITVDAAAALGRAGVPIVVTSDVAARTAS